MLFFQSMCNPAPYSNVEVDLTLKIAREEMLCLVISSAVRAIPEELSSRPERRRDGEDSQFLSVMQLLLFIFHIHRMTVLRD
jgi:hypothetical protein